MLVAVSLILPYLFGLGCLLYPLCGNIANQTDTQGTTKKLQSLAVIFVFGAELNYALVLTLVNLKTALAVGAALSAAGAIGYFLIQRRKLGPLLTPAWCTTIVILYVASLFAILITPLKSWDARSIWFFHGKMIFYHASVDAGGDWSLPSVAFSHPDYPMLIPIIAAQVGVVAGYWNEYLPKLSLVTLFFPALLCLLSILLGKWWRVSLIAVPLLIVKVWLGNGYMDGYLALYGGLACFFWGRWLEGKDRLDAICGILFLGITLDLKNEGALYSLIVVSFLAVFLFQERRFSELRRYFAPLEWKVLALVSVSGLLLWERKKHLFQLQNDLHLGVSSLPQLVKRATDGSFIFIAKHLLVVNHVAIGLGIFFLSLIGMTLAGKRPGKAALFCGFVAIAYLCGLIVIYMATPCDVIWHVKNSSNRTMLPVHMTFLFATFFMYFGNRCWVRNIPPLKR